jgi:GNAT superfamily N-acetyltransferase
MTVSLHPATETDLPTIARLADRIWRAHYPGIITHAQIDYMLAQRYALPVLSEQFHTSGHAFRLAVLDDTPVGFLHVFPEDDAVIKLDKLYLLPEHHGQGHGQVMLRAALDHARACGAKMLRLTVNKRNQKALTAYLRAGFVVEAAVTTDIGQGFVMDDFILIQRLATTETMPHPVLTLC